MEAKFLVSLLILGLVSTTLAKGGHHGRDHDHDWHHKKHDGDKKCPPLITSPDLLMKCSFSGDGCRKISCSAQVEDKTVTLSLEFTPGEGAVSVKISLKVPSLGYDWVHTFKNGDKFQVLDFPLKIKGVADADMYLMFNIYKGRRGVAFKVDMFIKTGITEPVDVLSLKGKLPHLGHDGDDEPSEHHRWSKCHRFASWFKRQSTPVKVSIILSTILFFLMVVFAITYCCKKRRASAKKLGVKPPSYEEATYPTKTKVPMEPLVNEE